MIYIKEFPYNPDESEREKASNSYVMSLFAIAVGLPLPIMNFLATWFFYLGNRKGTYFVRWHCWQALFVQMLLFIVNVIAVSWTISIIFGDATVSNLFIAYLITAILLNLIEFILTIYSAVKVNKGFHVEWWFFSDLTHSVCKPKTSDQFS